MRFFIDHQPGASYHDVKVENCFAFLPEKIERPAPGYLWGEFYGKVYEYYNGAWQFRGKLHRDFDRAQFENNVGKYDYVEWVYPTTTEKILYFIRRFLVMVIWVALILGVVLLVHKYF